jgi:hypothetical protein
MGVKPKRKPRKKSDFERTLESNERAGMPDGAAWALAEEMCGLDPGEGAYQLEPEDSP